MSEFTRPNGKPYRSRKPGLRARAWDNHEDGCGVIVFGTLDPVQARSFAKKMCNYWFNLSVVTNPMPGWYRDSFHYGERRWVIDDERGAPGVMFTANDEDMR